MDGDVKREIELAIIHDLSNLEGAAKRMAARIYQYRGYANSTVALSDAADAVYEIKKDLRKLREALEQA